MSEKKESKTEYEKKYELKPGTRRIRIQFDIAYQGDPGKEMDQEQITVPDMAMTVRQMLESAQGKNGEVKINQPLYFGTEVPTLTDFTDLERYRSQLERRKKEVDDFIAQEKQKADQKAAEDAAAKKAESEANDDPGESSE